MFGSLSIHDAVVNVGPAIVIGGFILTAANRLWEKFEARMDRGDKALLSKFTDLSADVNAHAAEDSTRFGAVNEQLTIHGNRISWLEGKAGVPLGSTPRERPQE